MDGSDVGVMSVSRPRSYPKEGKWINQSITKMNYIQSGMNSLPMLLFIRMVLLLEMDNTCTQDSACWVATGAKCEDEETKKT